MKKILLFGAILTTGLLQAQTNLNVNSGSQKKAELNPNYQKTYTSCGYLQENNALEDGRISNTGWPLICADDFIVPANECWGVNNVVANFFVNGPGDDVRIFFYSDNAGTPGTVIATDTILYSQIGVTLIGNNYGLDVHEFDCPLNDIITLCGGASGTTYWFSIQAISANNHYWEFTSFAQYGNNGMNAPAETGGWSAAGGDNFVFELNSSIVNDMTITECAPYSITIGSNTYDATGTYTETLTAVGGCDSIINLNLTIIEPSVGVDSIEACGSYTWIDDITYTTTTNGPSYTYVGGAANGCDSIAYLDLTINPMPVNTVSQSGAQLTADEVNATYQWINCDSSNAVVPGATSQNFIPPFTGNYAVVLTNGSGCMDTSACVLVDYTGIDELNMGPKQLVKVIDFMGRETNIRPNTPLIFIYSDGTIERKMFFED